MKYVLLVLLILMPLVTHADIYKYVDPNGNITYSDKPIGANSEKVKSQPTNIVPSSSQTPQQPSTQISTPDTTITINTNKNVRKPYTTFAISYPADQETIQNQPILKVNIDIDPQLYEGDMIQVYLDGNPWDKALAETQFEFTIPYRGTHTISATVFNKNMQALKQTKLNTIYVHQAHLGN